MMRCWYTYPLVFGWNQYGICKELFLGDLFWFHPLQATMRWSVAVKKACNGNGHSTFWRRWGVKKLQQVWSPTTQWSAHVAGARNGSGHFRFLMTWRCCGWDEMSSLTMPCSALVSEIGSWPYNCFWLVVLSMVLTFPILRRGCKTRLEALWIYGFSGIPQKNPMENPTHVTNLWEVP